MRRLNEVIGLPVMCGGRRVGVVSSLCLSPDARDVTGLNMQRGFRGSIFVPGRSIRLLGEKQVEVAPLKEEKARHAARFGPVCNAQGMKLGLITDAAIDERTLHVTALEVTFGPIDDLISGRRWVRRFTAQAHRIVIPVPELERGKPS